MSVQGDDLDDGLEYSYSSSEDEGVELNPEVEEPQLLNDDSDNKEDETTLKRQETGQKRNRSNKDDNKFKDKKKQKMEYDTNARVLLATLTPDIIAEKLATKIRSQNPDLSPLELSELYLNKSVIKYTGDWNSERNLIKLGKFIEYNFGSILPENPESKQSKKKNKKKTSKKENAKQDVCTSGERKFILVLSMSAIRACDVHRATKSLNGGSLKLIGKNKLKDDLKILGTTRARVLAGTAGRVNKILQHEDGGEPVLKFTEIDTIICDSSYLDTKKQHLWDVKEIIPLIKEIVDKNDNARVYLY